MNSWDLRKTCRGCGNTADFSTVIEIKGLYIHEEVCDACYRLYNTTFAAAIKKQPWRGIAVGEVRLG